MADLLIVEPDQRLGFNMCRVLEKTGHSCVAANSVTEAEKQLRRGGRVMTVLNARLPWRESRPFLRLLEEKGLPVLFITTDTASVSHLRALYQRGSDVLLAPFTGLQLVNAVEALLHAASRTLTLGTLRMDVEARRVTMNGEELNLTTQEFELLRALMQSPDAPVSRQELLRTAWGYQGVGITRTVDVHVQRLRRKIGAANIETVYKLGYRLRVA